MHPMARPCALIARLVSTIVTATKLAENLVAHRWTLFQTVLRKHHELSAVRKSWRTSLSGDSLALFGSWDFPLFQRLMDEAGCDICCTASQVFLLLVLRLSLVYCHPNLCTQPFLCPSFGQRFLNEMLKCWIAFGPPVTPSWIVAQVTKHTKNSLLAHGRTIRLPRSVSWTAQSFSAQETPLAERRCSQYWRLLRERDQRGIWVQRDIQACRYWSPRFCYQSMGSFPPWCQVTRFCCGPVETLQADWHQSELNRGLLVSQLWFSEIWKAPRLPFLGCHLCPRLCSPSYGSLRTLATSFARSCAALSRRSSLGVYTDGIIQYHGFQLCVFDNIVGINPWKYVSGMFTSPPICGGKAINIFGRRPLSVRCVLAIERSSNMPKGSKFLRWADGTWRIAGAATSNHSTLTAYPHGSPRAPSGVPIFGTCAPHQGASAFRPPDVLERLSLAASAGLLPSLCPKWPQLHVAKFCSQTAQCGFSSSHAALLQSQPLQAARRMHDIFGHAFLITTCSLASVPMWCCLLESHHGTVKTLGSRRRPWDERVAMSHGNIQVFRHEKKLFSSCLCVCACQTFVRFMGLWQGSW